MKAALCLLVRNEVQDIAEWIVHHLGLGFAGAFVYDNESDDGTSDLLHRLSRALPLLRIPWPRRPGHDLQNGCYDHALANLRGAADWVAFLDADEFLVSDRGESITDLLARLSDHAHIGINWRVFGSAQLEHTQGRLIMECFTRRAPIDFGPNGHIKSIVRPERMHRCVNPHIFASDHPVVDIAGQPITEWRVPGLMPRSRIVAGSWRLHHYFTRSRRHWHDRTRRGSADLTAQARNDQDFVDYDRNEELDETALAYLPAVRAALARLEPVLAPPLAPPPLAPPPLAPPPVALPPPPSGKPPIPPAIAFIHIPKTAGMAVVKTFERALGAAQCTTMHRAVTAEDFSTHRFISGHHWLAAVTPQAWRFTVLREPVAQIASHLRWLDHYNEPAFERQAQTLSPSMRAIVARVGQTDFGSAAELDKFFDWLPPDAPAVLSDIQCEVLSRRPGKPRFPAASDRAAAAIYNLRDLQFVGLTEQLDGDLIRLFRRLSLPVPDLRAENTVSSRRHFDLRPGAVRTALERQVQADLRLYEHVLRRRRAIVIRL